MGADHFQVSHSAATAQEAFRALREEAFWEHGHAGYTGTIAEKDAFHLVRTLPGKAEKAAYLLYTLDEGAADSPELAALLEPKYRARPALERMAKVFSDKWGPALCLDDGSGTYVFCGWASS